MRFLLGIIFAVSGTALALSHFGKDTVSSVLADFYSWSNHIDLGLDPVNLGIQVLALCTMVSVLLLLLVAGIGNRIHSRRYKKIAYLTKQMFNSEHVTDRDKAISQLEVLLHKI